MSRREPVAGKSGTGQASADHRTGTPGDRGPVDYGQLQAKCQGTAPGPASQRVIEPASSSPCRPASAAAKRSTSPRNRSGWIRARLKSQLADRPLRVGEEILIRGERRRIAHSGSRRGLVALTDAAVIVSGDEAHLARRLLDWLKAEAKRDLLKASEFYAAGMGVSFHRLSVRDQKSRWGSCSSDGTLVLFLAAGAGPALRSRLCRGARGGASQAHEPWPQLLALGSNSLSSCRARQELAQAEGRRAPCLCLGRLRAPYRSENVRRSNVRCRVPSAVAPADEFSPFLRRGAASTSVSSSSEEPNRLSKKPRRRLRGRYSSA